MADTGWKNPTATGGIGATDDFWTNPANAYSSNDVYATMLMANSSAYQSFYNFGFSIPAGATIVGLEVKVEYYMSGTPGANNCRLYLWKTDKTVWNGQTGDGFPETKTVEGTDTEGSSSTFAGGESWVVADFSNAAFAIKILIRDSVEAGHTFYCDHIQVKVYYAVIELISTATIVTSTASALSRGITEALTSTSTITTSTTAALSRGIAQVLTSVANIVLLITAKFPHWLKKPAPITAWTKKDDPTTTWTKEE